MDDQKNFILAMALSAIVLMGYWFFIGEPTAERARIDAQNEIARMDQTPSIEPEILPIKIKPREELLQETSGEGQRINIETPALTGSFQTVGMRLDDISLKEYDRTLDPADGIVTLLVPEGAERSAYIMDNWVGSLGGIGTDTPWQVVSGDTLTPTSPITLQTNVGDVEIRRVVSIDDKFLITLTDTLTNTGSREAAIVRTGVSRQHELPDELENFFVIQEGPISVVDQKYHDMKYKGLSKKGNWTAKGEGGWVGLTDKYWLQGAIAPQGKTITASYDFKTINDQSVYETSYTTDPLILTAGASVESVGHMYIGAKERGVLKTYKEERGIQQIDLAIDWGFLKILVRPISFALSWLGETLGNYGVGILALTLIIKILLFPLFNKQYESQAKMKKVQPALKKIQTRYKDDRMKLQQEMMALYKKEGVNPAAGCLPIIPTMFVFFALYKSVFIDIDLRHEPFFGYIRDLSAKDPLSILNGFGLFPWDAVPMGWMSLIAIGPLAIMYGISMALMYTLTPQPTAGGGEQAEMMAKMMKYMPWIFMFVLAPFATGLLIYWVWNNILSFAQQYYITRKFKVDTPIDKFIRKITGKPEPEGT
ncbi:membrane protein insertase YidC [Litorimonas sp. RW-G-Af-16]|uniref:membrane protein insertase YidC n=1 Tax=Litorimonas sp. RW-G-Af-16 TaxID=3241168 RepID=UPI00390C4480